MLATLCGTPYQVNARDSILVFEEIVEPAYKVDRMLEQLKQSGVLETAAGFAIGEFFKCATPNGSTWEIADILLEHLQPFGVPIIGELPIGHGRENYAFPVGVRGKLANGSLGWEPL